MTPHLMDATRCPACGTEGNTGLTFHCGTQHIGADLYRSPECIRIANERDREVDDIIAHRQIMRHFGEDE